jgi:hypothetical protein
MLANYVGIYREVFTFVHRFMALRFTTTAGCEAQTSFADESVCLMTDNFWN